MARFRTTQIAVGWLMLHDKPNSFEWNSCGSGAILYYDGDKFEFGNMHDLKEWIIEQAEQIEDV